MEDRFYGLSKEHKTHALLTYQKALIWLNCLEQQINEGSISREELEKSYTAGIEEGMIDSKVISLEEYVSKCYFLLRIYIELKRAFVQRQEEIFIKYNGEEEAYNLMNKITDTYYFLIDSLRKKTTDVEENTASNVTHILSAKTTV